MILFKANSFIKWLLPIFSLLVFLYAVKSGVNTARLLKQSEVVATNVSALRQGLDFFYNDYDRFPQVAEFSNAGVMQTYFNSFPPQKFLAGICQDNFLYKRASQSSYEINFCLAKDSGPYRSGWNKVLNN